MKKVYKIWAELAALCAMIGIAGLSCKTKTKDEPSAFDICMQNADYVWHQNKCIAREALLTARERCLQSEANAVWQNGECLHTDELNDEKRECLARGDGSSWVADAATGGFRCLSPAQIVTNEEHCRLQGEDHEWDETFQICLSPAGVACRDGGDYWTFDNRCVKPEEYRCLQRTDGSKFQSGRCLGPNELACLERGFQRKWIPDGQDDSGRCERKSFLEICGDRDAPGDVIQVLKVLKVAVGQQDCKEAESVLSTIGSLNLDNNQLTTLMPLVGFTNIKSMSLQNNKLQDLTVLNELTQITVLYLAGNDINSLSGIESLVNLKSLYLAENRIYDLKPLGNLPRLEALYLNRNQISSLSTLFEGRTNLEGLSVLETLDLSGNCSLNDSSQLHTLKGLKYLYLNRTAVTQDSLDASLKSQLAQLESSSCF